MIPVDKNIPTPAGSYKVNSYPFSSMEVGDSFLFPPDVPRATAYSYTSTAHKRGYGPAGARFSVRQTPEGMRCWRIK